MFNTFSSAVMQNVLSFFSYAAECTARAVSLSLFVLLTKLYIF